MESARRLWSQSRFYRGLLIAAAVYTVLRLVVQIVYLGIMLFPDAAIMGGTPDWVDVEGPVIPADLQIYLNAAKHFSLKEDLYLKGSLQRLEDHFPYAPSFALIFIPFLWFSPVGVSVVHTLLHIVVYVVLYICWGRIFARFKLDRVAVMLAWSLPIWLLFDSFWTDLGYLNIYIIMALFATLFIEAVLTEHFGWALFWLSVIVQIKPHWIFALAVPLLLGRWRFFFKLLLGMAVVYVLVIGATILAAGPTYGIQQYQDYLQFLGRLSRDFPWRGPEKGFLGYNHSIKQIIVFILGVSPGILRLATFVKLLLLAPLGVVCLRHLVRPIRLAGYEAPQLALDMAFAMYLGAFIWLDMVWELSLSIAIYPYLLGTAERRSARIWVHLAFLPYALLDPFRVGGFVVLGMDSMLPGPYIITDPAIYIPLTMVALLMFYALLIVRLWRAASVKSLPGA